MTDVAGNLSRVVEQIAGAARGAGRDPGSVQLVVVSKTKPVEMIREAVRAGARILGENYVQEARAKIPAVGGGVSWHLVGHLQRNKATEAVELFDVIQSLDNLRLARVLDRLGREGERRIRTLVEVNVGGESSKRGVAPGELPDFLTSLAPFDGLAVEGLMTIPPPQPRAEETRRFFRILRGLRQQLAADTPPNVRLQELSMGMSDDFAVAIEEGATIVRVGRAIFGVREAAT